MLKGFSSLSNEKLIIATMILGILSCLFSLGSIGKARFPQEILPAVGDPPSILIGGQPPNGALTEAAMLAVGITIIALGIAQKKARISFSDLHIILGIAIILISVYLGITILDNPFIRSDIFNLSYLMLGLSISVTIISLIQYTKETLLAKRAS